MLVGSLEPATYACEVHETSFEVPRRYTLFESAGGHSFGKVCAARNEATGELVAIKKIEGVFERTTVAKRTLRELRLLRHLSHCNVLGLRSVFVAGSKDAFDDVYIVSELMDMDLTVLIRSPESLPEEPCQLLLYQILRGMKFVHSAGVIHRDLKPRNVLINRNWDLRIADFGLARVYDSTMTEYICTRWYRAPEVLCCWNSYSEAIDVWSIGCILAELLTRRALFRGSSTQQMLEMIVAFLGSPSAEALGKIPNERCLAFLRSLPPSEGGGFSEAVFSDLSPAAVDLLHRTLKFNPDERVTVADALTLNYMAGFHCPEEEPVCEPLDDLDFEFERRKINKRALREEVFLEALRYYPEKHQLYLQEQALLGQARYDIRNYRLK